MFSGPFSRFREEGVALLPPGSFFVLNSLWKHVPVDLLALRWRNARCLFELSI